VFPVINHTGKMLDMGFLQGPYCKGNETTHELL